MKKRILSLLIALIMTVGVMSSSVFYADNIISSSSGSGPFNDVASTRWSCEDIEYCLEKKYMTGTSSDFFSPAGTMTRGMVVVVLYRMENSPAVAFTKKFKDVPEGKYYSDAVIWAAENKIVTGVTANTFEPNTNVTREQMATFFWRYANYKNIDTTDTANIKGYSDYGKISSYAVDAFAWANKVGLIGGTTKTTLDPKGKATREQFAAILHRYDTTEMKFLKVFNNPVLKSSYTEKEYPLVDNADFYVSAKGSDNNDGSFEHPFKTFEKARDAVRELKKTKTGEIIVAFMAGDYGKLSVTLEDMDSGTEATPITYCAYGDGDVNFVNGATISKSEFSPIDASDYHLFDSENYADIYKVDLSKKVNVNDLTDNCCLFGDGFTCVNARYPNVDEDGNDTFLSVYKKLGDRSIQLLPFIGKRFASYKDVTNIKVNGYFNYEWGTETALPVASYDSSTNALTFAQDTFWGIGLESSGGQFYYYNISEELDHDGEYYLDKSTGTLYVYKPTGNYNLAVYGSFLYINASYTTIRGMNFTATIGRPVSLFGHHNTFELCTITGSAGDLILRMGGAYNTVDSCEFSQMNRSGIMCGGGNPTTLEKSYNVINNCSIHDFGLVTKSYAAGFGIADGGGVGITFSHNEIYNCPHVAIDYGGVACTFEYNVIHDACFYAQDMGAFYAGRTLLNRDNVIRYNVFYNIGGTLGCTAIYLDDGLAGQTIYGNYFFKTNGWGCVSINGGRENYVCDNIMINPGNEETRALFGSAKYYYAAEKGSMEEVSSFEGLLASFTERESFLRTDPTWSTRYPHLAALVTNPFDITNPDCVACPSYCTIKNNVAVGAMCHEIDEPYEMFGEVENNTVLTKDDCDMFVDPTHGDYTIKDGVFTIDIPFEKIGRY